MTDDQKLDEIYSILGMCSLVDLLGKARNRALEILLKSERNFSTLGRLSDDEFLERCQRGTGRTTRTILRAILYADRVGDRVCLGVMPEVYPHVDRLAVDYCYVLTREGVVDVPRDGCSLFVCRATDEARMVGQKFYFFDHDVPREITMRVGNRLVSDSMNS